MMFISFIFIIIAGLILEKLSKKFITKNIFIIKKFDKKALEIDETLLITSIIENRKLFPVNFLKVTDQFPKHIKSHDIRLTASADADCSYEFLTSIMPFQRIRYSYGVCFDRRGVYNNWGTAIVAGDIFALSNVYKNYRLDNEVIVYPKSENIEESFIPLGSNIGELSVRRWIIDDPIVTESLREYTGSEPFKSIHWMSSLRLNKLMTRKYDHTTDSKAVVILNIESSKPFYVHIDRENIEKCISNTRFLFEKFEEMGVPYGFTTNAMIKGDKNKEYFEAGTGNAHMDTLLESLSRIDYAIIDPFENYLDGLYGRIVNNELCIIITTEIFNEYIPVLNKLKDKLENIYIITQKTRLTDEESLRNFNIYVPKQGD